ncbi:A kinase (PRKA) anchor protein 1b [Melanotaenia boesemani]|uniref:A kinase (PRKA) anchor protein 1b n=1 Tax=Melanotaenia boesemani TaxID=1250792 RepID=UPI001C0571B2|nr:A kinase (PRKA) anchor protein 1b [Melanotaenia boesemani]
MPLRFRSVVPYTLPGVLVLIGWWWYTSRKKERLSNHDGSEGPSTAVSLIPSQAERSNGLVEKSTVSPPHAPDRTIPRPSQASNQTTQQEIISHIHVQDNLAAPSLEQSCEEAAAHHGRIGREEVCKPLDLTLLSLDKNISKESLKDHSAPERDSSPALIAELGKHQDKDSAATPEASVEEVIPSCQATKVTSCSSTTAHLSDAERPEPEGEVAKHHSIVNTQNESVCAFTPAKEKRIIQSEADSVDTPPSAEDLHQRILTSTPTTSTAQDSTYVTPQDVNTKRSVEEEQDLELLAAGLITEVISAATQEVLGVTSCKVTENSQSSSSNSTPLASGKLFSQEDPVSVIQQHHHLQGKPECTEAAEKEVQGMPNGCPLAPVGETVEENVGVHQTKDVQNDLWPTASQQAASVINIKLKGDEAAGLAEDSACSTCHSEDGISSEDLQSSTFEHQVDVIQVTDLSASEATQPQSLAETSTEASEDNSVDPVCEIKRLNGIGLRNGAHGTCEVDTDQSGGSDVNSMDSVDSGCTMGVGESQCNNSASSSSELIIWEIEVPKHLVGRLIGKQGRYVSFLKQNSGAKIYISTLPYTQEFQICHIEGVQQQVDKALSLIGKKFKDLDLTNLYAPPPPPLTLPSLPMTSWLLLPSGVTVEVIVVNIVSAGHIFVQQHTHPTYHALRSLDQQMFLCYSQPGTPALPSPVEVGVICAAPAVEGAWWRAQVITFYKETSEVEIRYVDYGGYDRVKIDSLRQIRSDFVTLPFQGAEVLLDNIAPLPGEDRFSADATSAFEEMTRGVALLAQVSNYDNNTGLPLVHLWNMVGDEVVSVNRALAERGLAVWVDGF